MPQNSPSLSVVVNNYNYAPYLQEALDSALAQMAPGDELIVVDDGSTDESISILRHYEQEHGIQLYEQSNQGQMRTVRNGISAARGDIILLLDSDDFFLEGYFDRLRSIYRQNPDVAFVFSEPDVRGTDIAGVKETRHILDHMTFPPGKVGQTKWAGLLFSEFVGVPTSGVSLKKSLAEKIMSLPDSIDKTVQISATKKFLLGISDHEAGKFGFAADAIIVRCASALGVEKYYNEQPGFMYRIHGSNKYAAVPKWGRWYMRRTRKQVMADIFSDHFSIDLYPTTAELYDEFQKRSLPLHLRRRLRLRLNYCLALLTSRGSVIQKLSALLTTAGLRRVGTAKTKP
jgi:glycosyltransferase involved in cell wall biosynthesis